MIYDHVNLAAEGNYIVGIKVRKKKKRIISNKKALHFFITEDLYTEEVDSSLTPFQLKNNNNLNF